MLRTQGGDEEKRGGRQNTQVRSRTGRWGCEDMLNVHWSLCRLTRKDKSHSFQTVSGIMKQTLLLVQMVINRLNLSSNVAWLWNYSVF